MSSKPHSSHFCEKMNSYNICPCAHHERCLFRSFLVSYNSLKKYMIFNLQELICPSLLVYENRRLCVLHLYKAIVMLGRGTSIICVNPEWILKISNFWYMKYFRETSVRYGSYTVHEVLIRKFKTWLPIQLSSHCEITCKNWHVKLTSYIYTINVFFHW